MKQIMRLSWAEVCLATVFALSLLAAPYARADTYFTQTSGLWTNPVNWSAGLPTTANTNTYIGFAGKTNPATVAVHAGDVCVASNLNLGGNSAAGSGTLNMDGGSLSVAGAGSVTVGDKGTGSLSITGPSSMSGGTITVGNNGGSAGTMTIASGGSYSAPGGGLTLGTFGNGNLEVSNATLNLWSYSFTAGGGNSGGGGTANVLFDNASVTFSNMSTSTGWKGLASVDVTDGSAVTNLGTLTFGGYSQSISTLAVTNSYWYQGGQVEMCNHGNGGITGTLQLANSTWVQRNGSFMVGRSGGGGVGQATITNSLFDATGNSITLGNGGGSSGSLGIVDSTLLGAGITLGGGAAAMTVNGMSVVTNQGGLLLNGTVDTFAMTNGVWFQGGAVSVGASSTGSMQIANVNWVQTTNANNGVTVSGSGINSLLITNSLLDMRSNSLAVGGSSGTGNLAIMDSIVLCGSIYQGTGNDYMSIGGASVVTNYGTLNYGSFAYKFWANVTMTGGTWWQGGSITFPPSNGGSGQTGTLIIAGGAFLPQSSVTMAGSVGGVGSLIISNDFVALPSTLTFGSGGSGTVSVVNGGLSVAGTCKLGDSAGAGQCSILIMTNSAVTNWGTVNVSQNSAAVSSIRQIGGSWTVIGSNVNFGSSAGGAASYVVSNGVFQQTGGAFYLGSKTNFNCPAWVELDGTQRQFQVAAFTNYAYGVFSNNLAQLAGGLDITSTSSNALSISSTGVVSLVYVQDPIATGNFWGLRWLGTNGFAVLKNYRAAVPARLTWDDSALSPYYQNQINIFTGSENSVAYTYVGIKVAYVISKNKGTAVFFR